MASGGLSTPRRLYSRSNVCILCNFSFIVTEINENGQKIEKKLFHEKYKLTTERVIAIRKVIPDFKTVDDTNNGVCKKCFRRIEKVNHLREEAKRHEADILKSYSAVQSVSHVSDISNKRLLRSPSTPDPSKKKNKQFPSIELRHLVQIPNLFAHTSTQVHDVRPLYSQPTNLPDMSEATIALPLKIIPTQTRIKIDNAPDFKSAKRSLGFYNQEKENQNSSLKDGTVKVSIYYPSGKKTSVITAEAYKTICRALVRGTDNVNIDRTIVQTLCKSNPMQVVHGTAGLIQEECKIICKRGTQTLFQKKGYDDFFKFNWDHMYNELKMMCPSMLAIISSIVSDIPPSVNTKPFMHIMVTAAIGLHGRSQEMSAIQYMVGFLLTHGGCTQRDIERLAKIGVCVHPQTIHNKLASWQDKLDLEILSIRDSWANGGTTKYQLIGDNWDKNILPSYRTSDQKTLSLHLFNMYAIVDRVPAEKNTSESFLDVSDLDLLTFIPSLTEQKQLMQELTFIFATSVIQNVPQIGRLFKKIYPEHLNHTYSDYAGLKTAQYPLGIYDCNENKTQEVIQLLKELSDKYVPLKDGKIVEPVFFGGDRLTDERIQGAQSAMGNADTAKEKLEGFISKTEDFHRLMNFLEAIHKLTYNSGSGNDPCTAYYYRNLLNMRNVKGKVKNSYRPYKLLYYTILDAVLLLMFFTYFNLADLDSDIPIPENFEDMDKIKQIDWLDTICRNILQQFFFENNEDICHAVREVLSDPEHEVNYWTANLEDGHVKCHFCARTYTYVGSLKSHEMKVHGVQIKKEKKKATVKDQDQLQDYILMLFKLTLLHKNLDTAVDMGDGERCVRSTKYELPIYNKTNKVKYFIASVHLTSLISGVLPGDQSQSLISNRFVNVQGGKNNNIALDEHLEMLNRDSKITCTGHQTKESIIKHSKEYAHLINYIKYFELISGTRKRKGFHHLPSYCEDVRKVAKDLLEHSALKHTINRKLKCKDLKIDRNPFENCVSGLSSMIHRHKPPTPFRRLRDKHI